LGSENTLFELALFLLTSTRTVIDEPKRYGPRRLYEALEKLVNLPLIDKRIPDDPIFAHLRKRIADHPELQSSSVVYTKPFTSLLDSLIVDLMEELKKRPC
jgi:hypothetical protein